MRLLIVYFALAFLLAGHAVLGQSALSGGDSWLDVKAKGNGNLTIYWHESKPFIWKEDDRMVGIECEIIEGFKQFLANKHHINLTVNWVESPSFNDTYLTIRTNNLKGTLGVSAFSITAERKKEVDFSAPYMLDISVLISSKNIPVITDHSQLNETLAGLQAITIRGTTYESDLLTIKNDRHIDFSIRYIPSTQNILKTIQDTVNAFGFIDLPVYLMELTKNAGLEIGRQNLYPIKREGYAFIYPKGSDWAVPLQAYFSSDQAKPDIKKAISRHIDNNVYAFIENFFLQSNDNVMLLTHEKEIQLQELLGKTKQIEIETKLRNYLLAALTIILVFMVIIFFLYRKRIKASKILQAQKQEIEKQQANIEVQNRELEEQNAKLILLNEEKNYLIKILAHDLRTPINHVHGLAEIFLLEQQHLAPDQADIINRIIEAAKRLNAMIGKILDVDAVEGNRANLSLEEIDLCNLLKKAVIAFEKTALRKNIQLNIHNECDGMVMQGDPVYVTEIIENLISNALKFSESGKTVEVGIKNGQSTLRLFIKDEGPGLTHEDKEKLFQKFQQLSAKATDGEPSTGLGLSIVKKYAELMNGKVWCESEAGKGATFCVEFPKYSNHSG
jgi:signal transduction histidine kinase